MQLVTDDDTLILGGQGLDIGSIACIQQQHSDLPVWQEPCPLILELKSVGQTQTHLNESHTINGFCKAGIVDAIASARD